MQFVYSENYDACEFLFLEKAQYATITTFKFSKNLPKIIFAEARLEAGSFLDRKWNHQQFGHPD